MPELPISIFKISPLIRFTLLSLYVALTIPLPFLPQVGGTVISPLFLWAGICLGGIALYGALAEQVILDRQSIQVTYPVWVPGWLRRGWSLPWSEIKALKPRSTGQGGLVYYFVSHSGKAYLLPMRVAGFAQLVHQVQSYTGIDTTDVRPLSQPWMYFILLGSTLLLLTVDGWIIWTAFSRPFGLS
ncbi:hypothetical protein [Leptothermofonsia sp. ETS-13]|uniref:hypothetical protein n=1 Tax=Leptothermofonsia sp. ETS-13 TaxID=3035696 RepID=UPI003B9E455F